MRRIFVTILSFMMLLLSACENKKQVVRNHLKVYYKHLKQIIYQKKKIPHFQKTFHLREQCFITESKNMMLHPV